jgi:hypothetical protein
MNSEALTTLFTLRQLVAGAVAVAALAIGAFVVARGDATKRLVAVRRVAPRTLEPHGARTPDGLGLRWFLLLVHGEKLLGQVYNPGNHL